MLLSPSEEDKKQAVGAQAERALRNFKARINLKGYHFFGLKRGGSRSSACQIEGVKKLCGVE